MAQTQQNRKQQGGKGKGRTWNRPESGNKRGKQDSVNNFKPYKTGEGSKNARRTEEIIDTSIKESEGNPLELYTKYTRFAADAANLPFSTPLGVRFSFYMKTLGKTTWAVPGIMRLVFTPAIGISKDFTSPVNRSSTRFFTYLRSNQKASGPYDHQDITMMELALDSCYMFHAMCERIYETANAVTPLNEYYTRGLLGAQCVNLDDVSKNMQDFRGWINTFAYNISQFAMPKGITLFDRHRWMCGNYYTDSPSTRAQTYIFVPRGFWKYDNTVETGSQLTLVDFAVPVTSGGKLQYTVAELMAMGNDLLNAITGDEDFQYISGDIYNFYGGDVYALPYVEEKDLLVPKYDETVLSQIENATIVGEFAASPKVTQVPTVNQGAIIFNPVLSTPRDTFQGVVPFNFHWDSPNSGQVIEASRLIAVPDIGETANTLSTCGTELVNRLDVMQVNPSTGAYRMNSLQFQVWGTTASSVFKDLATALQLSQFDWAPGVWVYAQPTADGTFNFEGCTWDIDNFALIPENQIKWIHEACLWSLFEVGSNRTELDAEKA